MPQPPRVFTAKPTVPANAVGNARLLNSISDSGVEVTLLGPTREQFGRSPSVQAVMLAAPWRVVPPLWVPFYSVIAGSRQSIDFPYSAILTSPYHGTLTSSAVVISPDGSAVVHHQLMPDSMPVNKWPDKNEPVLPLSVATSYYGMSIPLKPGEFPDLSNPASITSLDELVAGFPTAAGALFLADKSQLNTFSGFLSSQGYVPMRLYLYDSDLARNGGSGNAPSAYLFSFSGDSGEASYVRMPGRGPVLHRVPGNIDVRIHSFEFPHLHQTHMIQLRQPNQQRSEPPTNQPRAESGARTLAGRLAGAVRDLVASR